MAHFRLLFLYLVFYSGDCSLAPGQCFQNTTDPSTFQLYQTDTAPTGIVTADFNNDGQGDVATISSTKNTLSIRYTTAAGSLGEPAKISVSNPFYLLAADLTNDGRMDLAVVNQDGNVLVLPNAETGFSNVSGTYEGIRGPSNMVQGDFNQDGWTDLALASDGSNAYRILTNTGTGAFVSQPTQAVPGSGQRITANDFDKDGRVDMAMITYSFNDASVIIYRNLGNATFTPVSSQTVTSGPIGISSGDLNGDNKPDLVVSSFYKNAFDVLLNLGNNQFEVVHTEPNVSAAKSVILQDVTGDTKPDLILAHWMESRVSVWVNTGNGQFQQGLYYGSGTAPWVMSVGDITGDGLPDIVTANSGNSTIGVLTNKGQGQFGAASIFYGFSDFQTGTIGDINKDGRPDVLGISYDSTNYADMKLKININKGNSQFTLTGYQPVKAASSALVLGDLNKDGWLDLVSTNRNSNSVSVLLNAKTGTGSFLPPVHYPAGGAWEPVKSVLSDINGDGFLDIATFSQYYYSALRFFINQGDGTLIPSTKFDMSLSDLSFTDLTNDGKPEMVILNAGYTSAVRIYTNLGGGQFSTPVSYTIAQYVTSAVSLDMNFDGYPDLLVSTSDQIALMLNKGDGTFMAFQTLLPAKNTATVRLQDLNEDGFPDLVTVNNAYSDTNENTLRVYLNTGEGSFAQPLILPVGMFTDIDFQDIDGDRRADITAMSENKLWFWFNCTVPLGYGFKTVQNGSWLDPAIWSPNRVPAATDRILLRHTVTLPVNYTGNATHIGFDTSGQLRYGTGSSVKLQSAQ